MSVGNLKTQGDKGNNWTSISNGLLSNKSITSLVANNSYLFSSQAFNSVWKYSGGLDNPLITEQDANINKFRLSQNYPNPFNPVTKIKFDIPSHLSFPNAPIGNPLVTLKVYDIIGKEISTLINEQLQPGTYETEWDGSNYPSGVYFYKLTAGDFIDTKRMMMIK